VAPSELAAALGVTSRYIRKLIAAGALEAVRLPNAGRSGRPELGRLRIPRAAARRLAESLGVEQPEQPEQWEQCQEPSSAA
jgi:excisionase family DNA binding protein